MYVKQFPNTSQKSFTVFLSEQGMHVPRQKVSDSLLRVDPDGVMGRYKKLLNVEVIMHQALIVSGTLTGIIN